MMDVFSLVLKFCRQKRKRTSAAKAGFVPPSNVTVDTVTYRDVAIL